MKTQHIFIDLEKVPRQLQIEYGIVVLNMTTFNIRMNSIKFSSYVFLIHLLLSSCILTVGMLCQLNAFKTAFLMLVMNAMFLAALQLANVKNHVKLTKSMLEHDQIMTKMQKYNDESEKT